MTTHFLIIVTHQGLTSEDSLGMTPLCYHVIIPKFLSFPSPAGPCSVDGLGHGMCFGQWNVSGHDLSPTAAEARNVFARFGSASWPPALRCGKSMLQGATLLDASLALTVPPRSFD